MCIEQSVNGNLFDQGTDLFFSIISCTITNELFLTLRLLGSSWSHTCIAMWSITNSNNVIYWLSVYYYKRKYAYCSMQIEYQILLLLICMESFMHDKSTLTFDKLSNRNGFYLHCSYLWNSNLFNEKSMLIITLQYYNLLLTYNSLCNIKY